MGLFNKQKYSKDLGFELNVDGKSYSLSGIGCRNNKINVPPIYKSKPVTRIKHGYKSWMTSISLPEGITHIGNKAFEDCGELKKIIIPKSIRSIGDFAFKQCRKLKKISIPNNIERVGKRAFGDYTFDDYDFIHYELVPACKKYHGAFYLGNEDNPYLVLIFAKINLKKCSVHKKTKIIADGAFNMCHNLETLTIPDGIQSIGNEAFDDCEELESVVIGNNLKIIEDRAFKNCKSLKTFTLSDSIISIGNEAFDYCEELESVVIGKNLKSIGSNAFTGCKSLKSLKIPDSVVSIGYGAFSGCNNLTDLNIPNGVEFIDDFAFDSCGSLRYNEYDNALYLGNDNNPYQILMKASDISITSCHVNNNTKFIYSYAFAGCSKLTEITVPNSLVSIGRNAFSGCDNLKCNEYDNALYLGNDKNPYLVLLKVNRNLWIKTYNINENTKLICDCAFKNCSLINMEIPKNVTFIGCEAFEDCHSLTSIAISGNITRINYKTFCGCRDLVNISIPDSVNYIGQNVFGDSFYTDCKKLHYTEYGGALYLGNNKNPYVVLIKSINDRSQVISVHDNTKAIYTAYTETITIPDSIKFIGDFINFNQANCSRVKCIGFKGTKKQWDDIIKRRISYDPNDVEIVFSGETID